jgi:hypothetical protein
MAVETQKPETDRDVIGKSFQTVLEGLTEIPAHNQHACLQIVEDHLEKILTAPGSRQNHQAWEGGYIGHLAEVFRIGQHILDLYPERKPPFDRGDFFLVMFLHDIEKVFAYDIDEDGTIFVNDELSPKPAKKEFRADIIIKYGIVLTKLHEDALRYVEGVRDSDYTPNARTMDELAALCNSADTLSARMWHDYPR